MGHDRSWAPIALRAPSTSSSSSSRAASRLARVIASREGAFEIARETLDDDASIDRDRIESIPFH